MKELIFIAIILVLISAVFAIDSDRDGISDSRDQYPHDYDNDQLPDDWELKNGLSFERVNTLEDPDNDGLKNYDEYVFHTDPNSPDTDGDGISDYEEFQQASNPLNRELGIWFWIIVSVFGLLLIAFLTSYLLKRRGRSDPTQRMEMLRRQTIANQQLIQQIKQSAQIKKQQKDFYNGQRKKI